MRQDRVTTLLGAATLLALGYAVFLGLRAPLDLNQGSLVRLFFVHVPTAWLSYLAYGGTGLFGLLYQSVTITPPFESTWAIGAKDKVSSAARHR